MSFELVGQLQVQNELGEGVVWDVAKQRLWWTDIPQKRLYRYDPVTQDLESWQTPERLCCFAPVAESNYLIAAFDRGFAYYQPESDTVYWLHIIASEASGVRLNDGRCDRQGRFWAGSMMEDHSAVPGDGQLYCLDHNLVLSKSLPGLSISNSLCWNPQGSVMYHCDTPQRRINHYPFNTQEGTVGEAGVFVKTDKECFPDGSTVDAQGYVWNAQWGGSQVVRYNSDGNQDLVLPIPTRQPTCVAFAGADLDLLCVTTAHQDMDKAARAEQPAAGDLFIYRSEFAGLPEAPFQPVRSPEAVIGATTPAAE